MILPFSSCIEVCMLSNALVIAFYLVMFLSGILLQIYTILSIYTIFSI